MNGFCKWWNSERGYGFVTGEDGKDYFVHFSDVQAEGEGKKNLVHLAPVEFQPERNVKGLKATKVKLKENTQ